MSPGKSPGFARQPDYRIGWLPCPKRVRVEFAGERVAESARAMLMREQGHRPVYYFPRADVRMELLAPSDHRTF